MGWRLVSLNLALHSNNSKSLINQQLWIVPKYLQKYTIYLTISLHLVQGTLSPYNARKISSTKMAY